ncbi:MFS transporter [Lyngbya confervoides BDU141951]|uniref:MFS transporter n=2 Tax=Lyngbya TaxID=28073 RepID=A0ABD4SZ52_9CYAN|nr:MFS transporter [Lyngbya confervoides]MCM1981620.1 MFS transporter [Lyngbya confervoides BDU141951]
MQTAAFPSLNLKTKMGYGIGELSREIPGSILVFFLLFFLTNHAGLNPGLAGTVLLLGKSWDAINDPWIGWLSDRTRSRWGRRFPWMLWGAVPLGVSFALIWLTPDLANQEQRFWYYSGALILLYTALTAIAIPHATLGTELTQTYDERTELMSVKSAFSIGSSILGLVIAQIIFSMGFEASQRYAVLGSVIGIIVILSTFLCVWGTYQRYWQVQAVRPAAEAVSHLPLAQQVRIAFTLKPFLIVMGIYLCSWIGLQVTAAILQYYVIDYMGLAEQHFTQMVLTVQGTALVMMLFWSRLGQWIGKRAIYCWGIPLTVVAQWSLFWLPPGQVAWMYLFGVLAGLGLSTAYLVPWSMLPDVMDLDELQTGQRREGIFCGFFVQLQKFGSALAIFGVGKILELAHYVPHDGKEVSLLPQPDSALNTIRWLVGPLPAGVLLLGVAIASLYPITKARHQAILHSLQARRSAACSSVP